MKKYLVVCVFLLGAVHCWGKTPVAVVNVKVDPGIAGSPWDMSGSSRTRNLIAGELVESAAVAKEIEKALLASGAAPGQKGKADIRVLTEFGDGGRAQFRLEAIVLGGDFVYRYVPGTAVDGNSNIVPDSFDEFSRRFTFNGSAGIQAVEAAARWGKKIEVPLNCETVEVQCEVAENDLYCTSSTVIC